MRRPGPARLFLFAGLAWQGAVMAWWLALAVRLAIELHLTPFQLLALGAAPFWALRRLMLDGSSDVVLE